MVFFPWNCVWIRVDYYLLFLLQEGRDFGVGLNGTGKSVFTRLFWVYLTRVFCEDNLEFMASKYLKAYGVHECLIKRLWGSYLVNIFIRMRKFLNYWKGCVLINFS